MVTTNRTQSLSHSAPISARGQIQILRESLSATCQAYHDPVAALLASGNQ